MKLVRQVRKIIPGFFDTLNEIQAMTFKSGFRVGRLFLLVHHFGVLLIGLLWLRATIWDWPKRLEILNQRLESPYVGLDIIWPFIGHIFSQTLFCLFLFVPLHLFFSIFANLKRIFSLESGRGLFVNVWVGSITFFTFLICWLFFVYIAYLGFTNLFRFWNL